MHARLDSIRFESPEFPLQSFMAIWPKSPWRQDCGFSMIRRAEKLGAASKLLDRETEREDDSDDSQHTDDQPPERTTRPSMGRRLDITTTIGTLNSLFINRLATVGTSDQFRFQIVFNVWFRILEIFNRSVGTIEIHERHVRNYRAGSH